MQALILHDDFSEVDRIGRALTRRGFMVSSCDNTQDATKFVKTKPTDIVVLKESIDGVFTTGTALAAEWRNPSAVAILISGRSRDRTKELFELVPSLQSILPHGSDPQVIATLALQAVQYPNNSMFVLSPNVRIDRPMQKRVA